MIAMIVTFPDPIGESKSNSTNDCVEVHALHPASASHDGVNIEVGLLRFLTEKDRSCRFSSSISTRPIPLVATCPKRNDDHQFNIGVCIEAA